jgi:hypothetical protein
MMATLPFTQRVGVVAALACALALALTAGAGLHASDHATALTRFQATVRPGTSLRVSGQLLVIDPRPLGYEGPVEAGSIEFRAAARTVRSGEVVLTVEPLSPLVVPGGGAAETTTTISFLGSGEGVQDGVLRDGRPETVARWVGSGLHAGRVTFVVRGPVGPQGASVPLRFLLASP